MKRRLLNALVLVLALMWAIPSSAFETRGEFQLVLNRELYKVNDNLSLTGQAINMSIIGQPMMQFLYFGPSVTAGDFNASVFTGSWLTKDGASLTASVWFGYKQNVFLEFDWYFPVDMGHDTGTYYGFSQFAYPYGKDQAIAFLTEHMGTAETYDESAWGPALIEGKLTFWFGVDITPEIDGNTVFFRAILAP